MKHLILAALACAPLAVLCPMAEGQAAAEYGAATGAAAKAPAPAGAAGKALSGAFDRLGQAAGAARTTETGSKDSDTKKSRPAAAGRTAHRTKERAPVKPSAETGDPTAAAAPAAPAPVYEDPREIRTGIEYGELIRRFGPPSLSVTTGPGKKTVWYPSSAGSLKFELKDGTVIAPPPAVAP